MRRLLLWIAAAMFAALPASAALPTGSAAPDFVTTGAMGGKPFRLHLARELRKGPVVLYFFPKAFTEGCTLEARAFSEANDQFRRAGARVIGLSGDDIATLQRFSVEECRNAFPVATASSKVISDYDVAIKGRPALANRTSYVIDRKGRIAFVHSDPNWSEHVSKTLAAVRSLKR